MAKEGIIGNLNIDVIDVDYEGKNTETAEVTVNNDKREITADVKKVPHKLNIRVDNASYTYDGSTTVDVVVSHNDIRQKLEEEIARATAREDDIDDRALHKSFHGEPVKEVVDGEKVWNADQEFKGNLNLTNTNINDVNAVNAMTANVDTANIVIENVQTENADTINALHANINEANIDLAKVNTANIENGNIENETVKVSGIVTANINKANIDTVDVLHAHIGDETVTSASINDADIATLDVTAKAEIKNASIETVSIDEETVTTANIDSAKVRTEEVGTSNITTANINHTLTDLLDADDANIDTLDVNVKANIKEASIETAAIDSETVTTSAITTANINIETVGTSTVGTETVDNLNVNVKANINDESVGTSDIGTAGIGTANIGTANIGVKANINEAAIGTAGIGDADIATLDVTTGANIKSASVETAAIDSETVTASDITTANIGTANVGTLNVGTKANINNEAVGTSVIGTANITTETVGTSHVTGAAEVDGNITTHSDLYVEAQKTVTNIENALKINSSGKVEKIDLTTASPVKNGKTLEYIDTISQDSIGKISATKKEITLTDGGQGTLTLNDSDITITNLTTSGKPTFTGVTLSSTPSADTDATTKKYVDDADTIIDNKLDNIVHIETPYDPQDPSASDEISYNANTVTKTSNYKNLKTGVTGSRSEVIRLANSTTAGLMSYNDYNTIIDLSDRVASLEGTSVRITYADSDAPTAAQIKAAATAYLASRGITDPTDSDYNGVSVRVTGTNRLWNYYANLQTYRDDGLDTVTTFTNSIAGIIKGAGETDGSIYAESNGTGSVYGWSTLKTRVSDLEINKQDNLSFDSAPQAGSDNPVTSQGIKTYVDTYGGKIDTASINGVNLLLNNKNLEIPAVRFDINDQNLSAAQKTNAKTNLDLQNVDNTADLDKPISTATQTALNGKQATISDLQTIREGAALGATALQAVPAEYITETELSNYHDSSKQDTLVSGTNIKTVNNESLLGTGNININSAIWGNISGTLSSQQDLQDALDAKQDNLTFDNVPVQDSGNPVKSGGIYTELLTKQPNLTASSVSDGTLVNSIGFDANGNLRKGVIMADVIDMRE